MSRFSNQGAAATKAQAKTTNLAGAEAYELSPRMELASLVLTSMLQDRFYADASNDMSRVTKLVDSMAQTNDLRFVAKTALYARHVHGLRSISHVLAGEIAHVRNKAYDLHHDWRRGFFDKIIKRVDDAAEILGYYITKYCPESKWTLPNAMKRGIAKALLRFDEYGLSKYQGKGKALTLIDVVNLCHPKAPAKHPIHLLMKGKIKQADTWENSLSEAGKAEDADAAKATEWKRLFKEKQIGYLACLRNLRNIVEQAPKCVDAAIAVLTDEDAIKKAMIFPFQFTQAHTAVSALNGPDVQRVLSALNQAMEIAVKNVPTFEGSTLIALDGSGSMGGAATATQSCFAIGSLFAAIILKANPKADLLMFADQAAYKRPDTDNKLMAVRDAIERARVNGGTNFHAIFTEANRKYDRIIILSDMQAWVGGHTPEKAYKSYCAAHKANPYIYSFDLAGHGTSQFPSNKVCALAGFSEKIFSVMSLLETDRNALVKEIENYDGP